MELLRRALQTRDLEALAGALEADLSWESTAGLCEALLADWHQSHEDVARTLQRLRDPLSVEALYTAALSRHDYLAYDDSAALARKCTWALADIGTPAARERLELLALAGEPVAGYARKRLEAWERESGRKRYP